MSNSVVHSLFSGATNVVRRVVGTVAFRHYEDAEIDPYEQSPMGREDLMDLFKFEPTSPWSVDSDMRASERLEHQSMAMIRSALYPPS